jgi:hypothetical protein
MDLSQLPDPLAQVMKCLISRIDQLEKELNEIKNGGKKGS